MSDKLREGGARPSRIGQEDMLSTAFVAGVRQGSAGIASVDVTEIPGETLAASRGSGPLAGESRTGVHRGTGTLQRGPMPDA